MSAPPPNEAEKNIEIWKVKKLIKRLESARGNGTSMISLIIRALPLPPATYGHSLTPI
jgi:peptide chain release factor subunit 1